MSCWCSERRRPIDVPAGSNDRPRQWVLLLYKTTSIGRDSNSSLVACRVCGASWRTKASYAGELELCKEWPVHAPFAAEAWETAAQGIETRSAIDAKRRGPKGESPVAKPCAQVQAPS